MRRKVLKDIGAAKARVAETRAAYIRAVKAYRHWLSKENRKISVDFDIPGVIKFRKRKVKGK